MYVTSLSNADRNILDAVSRSLQVIGLPPLAQFTQATNGTDALLKLYRQAPPTFSTDAVAVVVVGNIGEWEEFWRTLQAKPEGLPIHLSFVCPLAPEMKAVLQRKPLKNLILLLGQ
jgi:hypothetical protein